ncbi:hypothetical protein ADK18_08350 [Bacillus anthracis]|nr:hypothetical protein ADK18_08350 [Bacillus anthracis]
MLYADMIYHFDCISFLSHECFGRIYGIENNDEEAIYHYIEAFNENFLSVSVIARIVCMLCKYYEL